MARQPFRFIRGLHNLDRAPKQTVVTIGSFDGVHLGHQAIIRQLKQHAHELGLPSVAIIFEPQPHEFFSGEQAPPRLMRLREKVVALMAAGIDYICCLQFNERLRSLTAQQFIDQVLVDGLGTRFLVVGDDFRFGCDRSGDYQLLKQVGKTSDFEVQDTHTFEMDGQRVSSTRIRGELEQANLHQAETLLGRPYTIAGHVGFGQQLGRQWGVPTANVALHRYRAPLRGVFAVEATLADGTSAAGVANVGVRPTINEQLKPILEVHLLDFAGDLYGKILTVRFLQKLRDEQKFESLDALKQQIYNDIDQAKAYFAAAE
ncbi:MAG: bifunctional riboflavin kinase/FAD synthetase [Candidatus Pelagadaptatus aseana]|uniref:bifunctional riboflavin kinase/FAD synthetase n=1 Tax=Candidatus Pelagadaptatus aseana TaxID=3120508 RepID=UPI0039B2083F